MPYEYVCAEYMYNEENTRVATTQQGAVLKWVGGRKKNYKI